MMRAFSTKSLDFRPLTLLSRAYIGLTRRDSKCATIIERSHCSA